MNIFTAPGLSFAAFICLVRSCWTSKGKDYTYLYGKNTETGSLTPVIHKAFDPRVDE
jgi:DNA ligase-4